jgi:hypothetical protein
MGIDGSDGRGEIRRFPESPKFLRELEEVIKKARKLSGDLNLEFAVEQNKRRRTGELPDEEVLADEKIVIAAVDVVSQACEGAERAKEALEFNRRNEDLLEKAKEAKGGLEAAIKILETYLSQKS